MTNLLPLFDAFVDALKDRISAANRAYNSSDSFDDPSKGRADALEDILMCIEKVREIYKSPNERK